MRINGQDGLKPVTIERMIQELEDCGWTRVSATV
jgi:hypothetical protein